MSERLVLFDIDGTLLSADGVSSRALDEALHAVFRTRGAMAGYDCSGKTDPQIVRELLQGAGFTAAEIEEGRPRVLRLYEERLAAVLQPTDVRAKPGIHALLEALAGEPRVTLGLLTGNLEPCARLKLEPLSLNPRFGFGAFGSDDEDRYRLPAVAVERARAVTGRAHAGKRIVIVGDSIHDVSCGRELGVRAVAVASGRTPMAALAAENPDALFADFSDLAAALAGILG